MDVDALFEGIETLEDMAEHFVEAIEVLFVFHQGCAGKIIEILDVRAARASDDALIHRFNEGEVLLQRHRHLGGAQLVKEGLEHRVRLRAGEQGSASRAYVK